MKDIILERKGREKEPQQTLALKMFAAIILLAGSMIFFSLPVGLGTQNFYRGCNYTALKCFSVIACSVQGAEQPVPVTRPHCRAHSHSYANSYLGAWQSQGSCLGLFVSCLDLQT